MDTELDKKMKIKSHTYKRAIKAEKPKNKTKRKSKKITYIAEGDQGRKIKNNTKRKSKQNHLHTKGEIKAEKPKIKPEKKSK